MIDFLRRAVGVLERDGVVVFLRCVFFYITRGAKYFSPKPCVSSIEDYKKWIRKHEPHDPKRVKTELDQLVFQPRISVLLSIDGACPESLNKSVESVSCQWYPRCELIFYSNEATSESIPTVPRNVPGDSRTGNIVSTEVAPGLAAGEYIILLDAGDVLPPFAMFEIVKVLNSSPGARFLYSDEDKMDESGQRSIPFFKPGWSPDLFLFFPYADHLCILEKELLQRIGGFRREFGKSAVYDLLLRFTEEVNESEIVHIPKVLCHRRLGPQSRTGATKAKEKEDNRAAIADALKRRNISGTITDGLTPGSFRIKRKIDGNAKVSIVIPTRDRLSLIRGCVDSIRKKSTYPNYEIIVVDNNSSDQQTLAYLQSAPARVLKFNDEFNFSRINNLAVEKAEGEYIVFLNNDTEVITPDWIESLLEHAQRPEVGAVGCKLLYRSGRIQHAGVVLGMSPNPATGVAGHVFANFEHSDPGYFGFIDVTRNYSAVTAAAMMVRKSVFERFGGFDEALAYDYNDVDFCLRLRSNGFLIVYTPFAELYHFESASRGHRNVRRREAQLMIKRWRAIIKNDPYYSPHLSLWRANCEIRI